MKIYMDGHPLLGDRKGIGRYTDNLVREFSKYGLSVNIVTNELTSKRLNALKIVETPYKDAPFVNKYYPYKLIRRLMDHNVLYDFPIDLFENKENREELIFHATNFMMLPTKYAKQVVTIHDLAFMKFPEVVDENIYRYMMRWVPYSIKQANQIIAVSKQTKNDIISFFNIPDEKVNVIYSAAESKFKKEPDNRVINVREKYKLPSKYILFIGTLEPKKNISTLIEVIGLLKQNYNIKEKLVVVGARGWKFSQIFTKIEELGLQDDVIFTGYIADEDLSTIYSGASVFTFPSIYEGFGIPLLEAMQCEVPVIASNTSCIPEVVGEAGILIDPYDVNEWAEVIHQILNNSELKKNLIQKGLVQAGKFSWKKVADETLAVYEKALKG